MSRRLTFLSLFAGCGGFDLGFTLAGFQCISAFDSDPAAVEAHRRNLRSTIHLKDLSNALPDGIVKGKIDVVVAGPPCQGFSTAGKREINDPRNSLLLVPALIASRLSPKAVVVENVTGATAGIHRMHWDALSARLRAAGYRTSELLCNAAHYGVPQTRRRVLLIAWNTGHDVDVRIPEIPGGVLRNVLQKINGAPNHSPRVLAESSLAARIAAHIKPGQKLCNVRAGDRSVHTWQIPAVFGRTTRMERSLLDTLLVLRRRTRLRDYGDADPVTESSLSRAMGLPVHDVIASLLAKGFIKRVGNRYDLVHTFNGKYRRLPFDEPAPTVDTRFGDPRYFLHPRHDRGFTVREAARIQGFPDSFAFPGNLKTQYRLVGNAVPPPLAKQIACFLRSAFF